MKPNNVILLELNDMLSYILIMIVDEISPCLHSEKRQKIYSHLTELDFLVIPQGVRYY